MSLQIYDYPVASCAPHIFSEPLSTDQHTQCCSVTCCRQTPRVKACAWFYTPCTAGNRRPISGRLQGSRDPTAVLERRPFSLLMGRLAFYTDRRSLKGVQYAVHLRPLLRSPQSVPLAFTPGARYARPMPRRQQHRVGVIPAVSTFLRA